MATVITMEYIIIPKVIMAAFLSSEPDQDDFSGVLHGRFFKTEYSNQNLISSYMYNNKQHKADRLIKKIK